MFNLFIVFLLGFLLDWIEITLFIMPLMLPIVQGLALSVPDYGTINDAQVVWFAILVADTLQTSFLTPPVGFALFYLEGVCPPGVTLGQIYRGIIPFVILQLIGLAIVSVTRRSRHGCPAWPTVTDRCNTLKTKPSYPLGLGAFTCANSIIAFCIHFVFNPCINRIFRCQTTKKQPAWTTCASEF